MDKVLVAKETTVRRWIRDALDEGSKVSAMDPPVTAVRDAAKDEIELPPYRGNVEKKERDLPPHLPGGKYGPRPGTGVSLKTTRFERDPLSRKSDVESRMRQISDVLKEGAAQFEINGVTWHDDELPVPKHLRSMSVANVRIELEKAIDKLRLSGDVLRESGGGMGSILSKNEGAFKLVQQMVRYAVSEYKLLLAEPLQIVQEAARSLTGDIITDAGLDLDEVKTLKSDAGQAALVAGPRFQRFFETWITEDAPKRYAALWTQNRMKFNSIFETLASTGTLRLDHNEHSRLDEHLSKVDRNLVFDPGFRYYLSGAGGKHVAYWDWCRNAAQALTPSRYSGQF